MLIDNITKQPFIPSLYSFAGQFSCYDEDDIENYLNQYNPNNLNDRKVLAKYAVKQLSSERSKLSYRHLWMLFQTLKQALQNKDHDFSIYFSSNDDEYYYMPGDWNEIGDPRGFFEEILSVAKEEWKEDLEKACKEDPSTW